MHLEKTRGFVYILEVKDIVLPVCKIGMTTRNPYDRCDEINSSSTGDFIWAAAHFIYVDDCKKLESLVHSKLKPLRQKGREFFNISSEDANKALISIFESQSEIKKIEYAEIVEKSQTKEGKKQRPSLEYITPKQVEILQSFNLLLKVKGRPFGQKNRQVFGVSDGNIGVQWNLAIYKDTGDIKLGVNLEGTLKTGRWLIVPFILSELKNPTIETLKNEIIHDNILVKFFRDAWQGAGRVEIVEEYIKGREFSLSEMNTKLWKSILKEALTCLDENKEYKGRKKKQLVTLKKGNRQVEKDISPHLIIQIKINNDKDVIDNLQEGIEKLKPIYNWVNNRCGVRN